eukprot:gene1124-biopygen7816
MQKDVQALGMASEKNKKRDQRMHDDVRALGMAADAELNVLKKKDNMQLNIIKELDERESKSSLVFNQNFKRVDSQIKNTVGAIQNIGSTVGRLEKRQNDVLKKLNLIKQNIATLRNTDMTTEKDIKENAIAINELSKEIATIFTGDGKLAATDSIMFQKPDSTNTDPYSLRKIIHGNNKSSMRLTINDDPDEVFEIWGDSCRNGGCEGDGAVAHKFTADGNAWHKGGLTAG